MKPSLEASHEDDASGEAWFQKGVTLLEERKHEREFEEALKKRMAHPALCEPAFWIGIGLAVAGCSLDVIWQDVWYRCFWMVMVVIHICGGMEDASQKRMKAMLEWIEHQKRKQTPES
jgi:hypothetical protein